LSQAFFLVLLLNQRWPPPLRLQVSYCSTFRTMCDVPNIAIFCSESIECFPIIIIIIIKIHGIKTKKIYIVYLTVCIHFDMMTFCIWPERVCRFLFWGPVSVFWNGTVQFARSFTQKSLSVTSWSKSLIRAQTQLSVPHQE
jgi:hypothetical protein